MRARVLAVVLAAMLAPGGAVAEAASGVRLVYARGDGADDCPDPADVRAGVAAQLGRDPFTDDDAAALTVTALLARAGGRIFGRVEVVDEHGQPRGARQLDAATCAELAPALELVIAMAVEPWTRAPAPPSVPPPPVPPPPRRHASLQARLSAGVLAAIDAAPAPALGFAMQVALAAPRWSLGLELRGDLPAAAPALFGGSVETSLVAGFLVPCVRHRILAACALAGIGVERGAGSGYDQPARIDALWAAVGARLAVELTLVDPLGLRLAVDVLAPLTRTELYVGTISDARRLYRTPAVSSAFGAAVTTHFP
jgi:hypothetical protein